MAVVYPRRYLKTRRQAVWQCVALLCILLPPLGWRIVHERPIVAIALAMLALAPFAHAYRALRFLAEQERRQSAATSEMTFVFGLAANLPLTTSGFLLILLAEM